MRDLATGSEADAWNGFSSPATGIASAIGGDGGVFVTGHEDGKVCVWDARTAEATATFVAHPDVVSRVDLSASLIVSGASDTVRLWDLGTRNCLTDVVAHRKKFDEGVTALAFHPSLPEFASGGGDGVVKVFSAKK